MVGQLASSVQTLAMTIEKGKFPSQPVSNPKGVQKQVPVHHSSMERSKLSRPCEKKKKSTTKWRCR
ncbi:hypothetical protein CUMW_172250 [Citrus unshiu]|uniref:Uncharacterized protein n=2 Tax=Citrus TaxID=2706 RepID=A0A2H5PVU9_CITUN|nr:hypothetical protein CUMW_172250 [Citrus unshiu]